MNQQTIDRLKATIAQNNQMNTDITEVLTLAEQGWQSDLDGIAREVQIEKDAFHDELVALITRAETAETKVAEKEAKIAELTAENEALKKPSEPIAPVEEVIV